MAFFIVTNYRRLDGPKMVEAYDRAGAFFQAFGEYPEDDHGHYHGDWYDTVIHQLATIEVKDIGYT